jgi:hypothetical protein
VAYLLKASLALRKTSGLFTSKGAPLREMCGSFWTMWNDKALVETGWLALGTKEPPSWC